MSNHSNMTADEAQNHDGFFVAKIVCYFVISIVGSFANLVICVGLARGTMKSSEYFIFNLAIVDLLVCAIGIPLDIYLQYADSWPYGEYPCHLIYPSQTMLILISIMNLMGMSLERHRAICTPLKQRLTPKQILISIAFIWLIAIAAVIPYANALKYSGNNCTENWSVPENGKYYTLALFVMDYCVPLTIITYCYVRAGHVLHTKFKKLIVEKSTSAKQNLATTKRFKQNKKVIKIFSTAVMLFVICVLPGDCYWMWFSFRKEVHHPYDNHLQNFSTIMLYANSAINPFIFGAVQMICHRKVKMRFTVQLTSTTVLSRSKGSNSSNGMGGEIQRSLFSRKVIRKRVKYTSLNTNNDEVAKMKCETKNLNNARPTYRDMESKLREKENSLCDIHSMMRDEEQSLQEKSNHLRGMEIESHDTQNNLRDTASRSRDANEEFPDSGQDTSNLQTFLESQYYTDADSESKWNESVNEARSISSDSCATLNRESDTYSVTSDTAQNTSIALAKRTDNTNGKLDRDDNTENGVCNTENGVDNTENGVWNTENGLDNTANKTEKLANGVNNTERKACITEKGENATKNRPRYTENGADITENGVINTEDRDNTNSEVENVKADQENRENCNDLEKDDAKPGLKIL